MLVTVTQNLTSSESESSSHHDIRFCDPLSRSDANSVRLIGYQAGTPTVSPHNYYISNLLYQKMEVTTFSSVKQIYRA